MTDAEQPDRSPARDRRTGRSAAAARIQHQATWVDLQLRQAEARGDFDDLPGFGKPLEGLGATAHDPDWWLKRLIEREQITGVLPPALQLRKDDAELDARLDRMSREAEVQRWRERRAARAAARDVHDPPAPRPSRRRWWRRG